nr:restriction endonuclease subunit S [uncultured Cohaesibacter sp.]
MSSGQNPLVPELRFPEFEGEWMRLRLGQVATFQRGFDLPSHSRTPGPYKVISSGGVSGSHIEAKVDAPGIVTGRYGSIGDHFYLDQPFWPLNTALFVKDFHGNLPRFVYFALERVDFKKLSDKTGVPGVNRNDLHREWSPIPSLSEQQKIASFLDAVSKKIELLNQKKAALEDYKRGLMQQLFSGTLRFTRPDGSAFPDWEDIELGELLKYQQPSKYLVKNVDYSDEFETPVLTAGKTFILGYTSEKDGIFSKNLPVIIFDDFTTDSKFVDFAFKAKSSAMKILEPRSSEIRLRLIFELMKLIQYKPSDHKRHWISQYQFFTVPIPHPDEQAKIADALSALDAKIEAVSAQISQVETFKKGLLQKMFV